ncbi:hypothetical protein CROQUDRAFT_107239 [Cronartium quercuum f. sp. fusiforme G11]|uniref:Uncharacterized protein n=1 Tax=Cronartium quercuum f. sp. fusiforme G11 TaxID=708437 RepID=A0A9P6TBL1_9BASI|nr:hypothetical protein CROQUDRAFT_107239 [Cronartium quercuum f. sp. fusiforme G11]
MCGRFALSLSREDLDISLRNVDLQVQEWINAEQYRPNYNIAPRTRAVVIRQREPKDVQLVLDYMQWGLIPHWTQTAPSQGTLMNTINARDDKVLENKGLWNSVKSKKRCIIVCEGFYEWLDNGKEKIPHFTKQNDGKLMCLAGLWDSVTYKGESTSLHTFTIITTNSNKYLSFLHDRMPVILSGMDTKIWLNTSNQTWSLELARLLKPFVDPQGLLCYPVPKEVGKVGNQSADFLKPVSQRKGNIASFFSKQKEGHTQRSTSSLLTKEKEAHLTDYTNPDSILKSEFQAGSSTNIDRHKQKTLSHYETDRLPSFPEKKEGPCHVPIDSLTDHQGSVALDSGTEGGQQRSDDSDISDKPHSKKAKISVDV